MESGTGLPTEPLQEGLDERAKSRWWTLRHPGKIGFLESYVKTGTVWGAARALGWAGSTNHYRWLKDDPNYAFAFEQADEEATQVLISAARQWAIQGIEEPVVYGGQVQYRRNARGELVLDGKGEPIELRIPRRNPLLLMFLIKAKRPEYRDGPRFAIAPEVELDVSTPAGREAYVASVRDLYGIGAPPDDSHDHDGNGNGRPR